MGSGFKSLVDHSKYRLRTVFLLLAGKYVKPNVELLRVGCNCDADGELYKDNTGAMGILPLNMESHGFENIIYKEYTPAGQVLLAITNERFISNRRTI